MQLDQYGQVIQGASSIKEMQSQIAMRKARQAQAQALNLIKRYNRDPRSMEDEEAGQAILAAQQLGYSVARGREKDTASAGDIALGLGVGALDSLLFGVIKNEWYSNRRNKDYVKAGRLLGLVGGMATGAVGGARIGAALTKAVGAKGAASLIGRAAKLAYHFHPVGMGASARSAATAGAAGLAKLKGIAAAAKTGPILPSLDPGAIYEIGARLAPNPASAKLAGILGKASQFAGPAASLYALGKMTEGIENDNQYAGMLPPLPQQY